MSETNNSNVICPFCGEDDFDLIGLKIHLKRYCEKFDSIDLFDRIMVSKPQGQNDESR